MELLNIIHELKTLLETFKNQRNHKFSTRVFNNKLKKLNTLKTNFTDKENNLRLQKFDLKIIVEYKTKFFDLFKEAKEILNGCKDEAISNNSCSSDSDENADGTDNSNSELDNTVVSESSTMSAFNVIECLKVIPFFNGDKPAEYTSFLELVRYIYESLNNDDKKKLIEFVSSVKISESVKNKLCHLPKPENFDSLKQNFESVFACQKNPLKLQSELSKEFQGNRSIKDFASSIETLISQLNSVQIKAQGADNRNIICKLNDEVALNSFKNGINSHLKPTIFAAQPKTFSEAVKLAEEIEVPKSNVSHFQLHKNNKKPFNKNFNNKTNNYSKGNNSNNSNFRPKNNYQRNNQNNNNHRRYNNRRVNNINSGNGSTPDQHQPSGQNIVQNQ